MSVSIKEIFDKLKGQDRAALNYAFETGVAHFVKLSEGRYIGVNVQALRHLKADAVVGKWSVGKVTE